MLDQRSSVEAKLAEDPRDDDFVWSLVRPIGAYLGGPNIVMQLSRLGVGRGVAESTVDSGRLDKHPVKRARTTFGYVVAALLGTPAERTWLRGEVDRAHRAVRSAPGAAVQYTAFDPDLQLWVAACICKGLLDQATVLRPDLDDATRDRIVRVARRIATTLQVDAAAWPADAKAFDDYWSDNLQRLEVDEVTSSYLHEFLRLRWLGPIPSALLGRFHTFVSTGLLSDEFRSPLGLAWSDGHQQWFDRLVWVSVRVDRLVPAQLAQLVPRLYLRDLRRRHRHGKPFI
ncbi:MAG: oxygenase MpaB family protein [Acidimicrobiales bacterium]